MPAYPKSRQLRHVRDGNEKTGRVSGRSQTVGSAKKGAWKMCSRYIRTRDCIRTTGSPDRGKCCTCNAEKDYHDLQAGHWTEGRHNSVLFDKRNIHAQCIRCNYFLSGNPIRYKEFMEKRYGAAVMEEIAELDRQTKEFTVDELNKIKRYFIKEYENIIHRWTEREAKHAVR